MAKRIKKDDQVVVITGRDKGETGRVLKIIGERVLVEGVNRVKRHQKPTQQFPQGGIMEKEAPVHISNVMLLDTKENKPTRVKAGVDSEGNKVRVAVRSGTVLE